MPAGLELPVSNDRLTLAAYVSEISARFADHEAIVFGDSRLTYRQLESRVRQFAKSLLAVGVTKGTKVGVLVANRPEFIIAAFATSMAGGIIVPISTLATAEERHHILRHSDTALLVSQDRLRSHHYLDDLAASYPGLFACQAGHIVEPAFPFLRRIVVVGETVGSAEPWDAFVEAGHDIPDSLLDAAAREVTTSDDAIIIYTSGTTAEPKAVLHIHRSVSVQMWRWAVQLELGVHDRVWTAFPFFWTAGFSMMLGGTLSSGSTLVLQEVFDAGETLKLIERERITTIHALEHTDTQLASHPDARSRDLSSLTHVRQTSALRNIIGSASSWDPRSGYGSSETFTISTALPATAPLEIRSASHGLPLPGMQIRIVDPEGGRPVLAGQTGEIVVKGVTLMRGYYKLPPEDALDDEGWFHTKDAGYLDENGYLHWSGRISGLIKTAGANVSPIEVENRANELNMLGVCSVVGVPHPTLAEAVVLAGVPVAGVDFDRSRLMAHLGEHLASYKVPKRVLLFEDKDLDFTTNEKVRIDGVRRLAVDRLISTDDDQVWVSFLRDWVTGRERLSDQ
jgi:acyl-CoA synthetase (AMP-forming)/AMP-acid ligase II